MFRLRTMLQQEEPAALVSRVLDVLDQAVAVRDKTLDHHLYMNARARSLFGEKVPEFVIALGKHFLASRRDLGRAPPAIRFQHQQRGFFLRVVASPGEPPLEVLFIREEVLRDPELFRALNARYEISHREFQVVNALRAGKTNKQIAGELGLADSTVARHVANLLERLAVPNRTGLVQLVETLAARRA